MRGEGSLALREAESQGVHQSAAAVDAAETAAKESSHRDSANRDTANNDAAELLRLEDLNNFFCNLPGGLYRANIVIQSSFKDKETFREAFVRFCTERGRAVHDIEFEGYSAKKLDQRPDEFFKEVDASIVSAGLNLPDIESAVQQHYRGSDAPAVRAMLLREIHKTVFPAYLHLRSFGYTHRDLTG